MGVEIERKFLVVGDGWRDAVSSSTRIVQGYLTEGGAVTVRVRVRGEQGYLTIKGKSEGISRSEYEYRIPATEADAMLAELAQGPVVEKTRHLVEVDGHTWEVDVFAGANANRFRFFCNRPAIRFTISWKMPVGQTTEQ